MKISSGCCGLEMPSALFSLEFSFSKQIAVFATQNAIHFGTFCPPHFFEFLSSRRIRKTRKIIILFTWLAHKPIIPIPKSLNSFAYCCYVGVFAVLKNWRHPFNNLHFSNPLESNTFTVARSTLRDRRENWVNGWNCRPEIYMTLYTHIYTAWKVLGTKLYTSSPFRKSYFILVVFFLS